MFLLGKRGRGRPAIVTQDGVTITVADLLRLIGAVGRVLGMRRKLLVAIVGGREPAAVLAYLGALAEQHCCALYDVATTAARQHALIDAYRPDVVVYGPSATHLAAASRSDYAPGGELPYGGTTFRRTRAGAGDIFDETALLLTTSGSTGSARTVRLSRANLTSNAAAIAAALGIHDGDRGITSLPLHYCYGLSVLNSHLMAGGSVTLCDESPVSQQFWRVLAAAGCTSLAGVPTVYQLLHATGFDVGSAPSLRMMTQAGARLDDHLVRHFAAAMDTAGGRFMVMYGQTEATARISVLPHEELRTRPGSVGRPVPGGRIWIAGPAEPNVETPYVETPNVETPDGVVGRVMYAGPNVMLGYAAGRADLASGDTLNGVLDTGDSGYLRHGMLYLTGRVKRIVKVHGRRVDLDDLERAVRRAGPAAVLGTPDEQIEIFTEVGVNVLGPVRDALARDLRVPRHTLRITTMDSLPTTSSGKVDYPRLARRVRGDDA